MTSRRQAKRWRAVEPLEGRRLMSSAPLVLTGGAGANTLYLREDADHQHLDVWQNAAAPGTGAPTSAPLFGSLASVTVNAAGTAEAVTFDFANGDPFPAAVAVNGTAASPTTFTVTGLNAAAVKVGTSTVVVGRQTVSYAALQGLTVVGSAGNDTLTQTAQPAVPVTFAGGTGSDTVNVNAGTFTLPGVDPAVATANLTVNVAGGAKLLVLAAPAGTGLNVRHFGSLSVAAGGAVVVAAPASAADRAVIVTGLLSLGTGASMDLTANDLIVRTGWLSSLTAGLTSSSAAADPNHVAALGVSADKVNGYPLWSTFDGQPVSTVSVVARYTTYGDANLDGTINAADTAMVNNGLAKHLAGWANGDFNGDGAVTAADLTLMNNAVAAAALRQQLQADLADAAAQARRTIAAVAASGLYPLRTNADGSWTFAPVSDWTAGTWAGELWNLYAATGDAYFKTEATAFTRPLSVNVNLGGDGGPRVFDGYDPLLQQEPGNAADVSVLLAAAASKAATFNPTVGAFKSWFTGTVANTTSNFGVLTDYIMDEPLLFWAAAQSGNATYYNDAVADATTIETYNVHADGSTSQFAFFDPSTGRFSQNETYQGYANNSVWSRGQAWAIDGFAQTYVATGRADFLATAERAANYFIAHEPADHVPYWDFTAPVTATTPRDTSAAAVAASGLIRLGKAIATTDPADSARYRSAAADILASLSSPAYLNPTTAAGSGVLLHAASNVPAGVSDNSLNYGDYFFTEAVNEYLAG